MTRAMTIDVAKELAELMEAMRELGMHEGHEQMIDSASERKAKTLVERAKAATATLTRERDAYKREARAARRYLGIATGYDEPKEQAELRGPAFNEWADAIIANLKEGL